MTLSSIPTSATSWDGSPSVGPASSSHRCVGGLKSLEDWLDPVPLLSVMMAGEGLGPGPEGAPLRSAHLSQDWTLEVTVVPGDHVLTRQNRE